MPKGNPIGSKSSVFKQSAIKKRKGYKGTPRWAVDRQNSEPKSVFFKYVDVGPKEVKAPNPSVSKQKLSSVNDTDSEEEYAVKEKYIPEGYRLVYMGSLKEIIQRVHDFSGRCEGKIIVHVF